MPLQLSRFVVWGDVLLRIFLDAGKDKLKDVDRLILQPNNREDDLRIWLMKNGFTIVAEAIMTENGKILRNHSGRSWSNEPFREGDSLWPSSYERAVSGFQAQMAT